MRVTVFEGDITEAPAEAVCSPTTQALEADMGIGATLAEAGGPDVRAACAELIRNEKLYMGKHFFPTGTAHWTTAGNLAYKGIIHCVVVDPFADTPQDVVRRCTEGALRLAGIRECESIAMPIFSTGAGVYHLEETLETMLAVMLAHREDLPAEVVLLVRKDSAAAARKLVERHFPPSSGEAFDDDFDLPEIDDELDLPADHF